MDWRQQFEIINKIFSQRLLDSGEKATITNIAKLLGIPFHKYQSWAKGQKPVREDWIMLAQNHGFNANWLLLGIGDPLQEPLDNPLNPDFVDICDTLHEMIPQFPDKIPKIAEIGGITTTDLDDIIHTQALPPATAIAKWVIHYRLNANFLLAQIGRPFLSEEQYNETGKLDSIRERRGDFRNGKYQEQEALYLKMIDGLKNELETARKNIERISTDSIETNAERRLLQEKVNNLESENRDLQAKIADMERERIALKKELNDVKKKARAKVEGQE